MVGKQPARYTIGDHLQHYLMNALSVFLLLAAAWAAFNSQWEAVLLSVLAFLSRFTPRLIEQKYKISLPIEFHATVYLFMFASLFLGSVSGAYWQLWWWDIALHIASGIVVSFAAFLILYTLYLQNRLNMTPAMVAFFAFSVGLAAGAVWEIWEYFLDVFFGQNAQGGVEDTMQDLVVDALGALLVALAGYFYIKKEEPGHNPIKRFVRNFEQHNPQLFGRTKK